MFTAYELAVKVSLINAASGTLLGIIRQFGSAEIGAARLRKEMVGISKLMIAGGAAAGLGIFGLRAIGKTVDAGKEYAHQLAQMNAAGMTHLEILKAQTAAYDALKAAPTSSVMANLAAIRELRMVFGNTPDAMANMPTVQKLQAILAVQNGHNMGAGHDAAYTVAKALELKGAVRNPSEFTAQADAMTKAIIASGGKVTPQDFLSAFKYGRTATAGWSDQFVYTVLPTLIQEMKSGGGSGGVGGPGNALMSAYQAVVSGAVPQKAIPVWEKLGLIDSSKVVHTKTGATKGLLPGAIQGSDLFQANPFQWAQTVLDPALRKAGITQEAKVRQTLGYLFPSRTAGFMMTQLAMQGWKFQRDAGLIQKASGLSAYNTLLKTDPYMAQMALQQQWNTLMATLGFQIMPAVLGGTLKLMAGLRSLATMAHNHPLATRAAVGGAAALSGLLVIGGGISMIAGAVKAFGLLFTVFGGPSLAAVRGLVPVLGGAFGLIGRLAVGAVPLLMTGLEMLGGALGTVLLPAAGVIAALAGIGFAIYEIVKHWDASKSLLWNLKNEFRLFINWLIDLADKLPGVNLHNVGADGKPVPTQKDVDAAHGKKPFSWFPDHPVGQFKDILPKPKADPLAGSRFTPTPKQAMAQKQANHQVTNHNANTFIIKSSDPHGVAREVLKLFSGGPQPGSSTYDPSAVMPQVASSYAV